MTLAMTSSGKPPDVPSCLMEVYSKIPYEIFTIETQDWSDQIAEWLEFVKRADPKNRTFTSANFKNGKIIEPEISDKIWQKIQPNLPPVYTDAKGDRWSFIGPSKYVMYAELECGQSFPIHTDTGAEYDKDTGRQSKFTVLVYLNASPEFEGGTTQFYTDFFEKTVEIVPKPGKILVFDIDLYHGGMPIQQGTKYWIGTELVCLRII